MLGLEGSPSVQKVRFSRLRDRGEFIEPAQELACGPMWAKSDVERWAAGERGFERVWVPELVGSAEVAQLLGVNKSTVHRRRSRVDDGPHFPEPAQELENGPVWVRADIKPPARKRAAAAPPEGP